MSITRTLTRTLSLACCIGLTSAAWSEEEGKKITIDQLPAAVKAALLQQAGGAQIKDIEEETSKDGKTVYEAEIVANGVTTEVKLDATGKVLKTKVEKEGDDDKDEKGNHEHQDGKDDGEHEKKK